MFLLFDTVYLDLMESALILFIGISAFLTFEGPNVMERIDPTALIRAIEDSVNNYCLVNGTECCQNPR